MKIDIDNHQAITGLLTAALIALGGYTYHKLQQIEDNKDTIALLSQKLDEHLQDYNTYVIGKTDGKEAE